MTTDSPLKTSLSIAFTPKDFAVSELDHRSWETTETAAGDRYWSGEFADASRQFTASMLWSTTALYVRFVAAQSGPLVVSDSPVLDRKTIGLWDRDVCEIFIASGADDPKQYFEFEIAPTGEWIDLRLDVSGDERMTDWEYASGMESAVKIEANRVTMAMKIPWTAFGVTPDAGDVWRGNLFRCVGADPGRGYLAWQPTRTPIPQFHVPEKFGKFVFKR